MPAKKPAVKKAKKAAPKSWTRWAWVTQKGLMCVANFTVTKEEALEQSQKGERVVKVCVTVIP